MDTSPPSESPSFGKVLLSFAVGILVGVAFVLPAFRGAVTLDVLGDPGPVGSVVLVGVLSVMVVSLGMFTLYQLFWLVDR